MSAVSTRSLSLFAAIAVQAAACTLSPGEGKFVCKVDDDCPEGWECQSKRCYIGSGQGTSEESDSFQETDTGTETINTDIHTDTGPGETDSNTSDSDTGSGTGMDTSSETDTPTGFSGTDETDTVTDTPTVPGTDSLSDSETPGTTDQPTDTETATASTDTWMDTGTDTGQCECVVDSGPCCKDNCQLYTRAEAHLCSTRAVLSCKTPNCGGTVEELTMIVQCDGKSAQCQGAEVLSQKNDVKTCQSSQKCVEDGTDASCVEDTGCL